MRFPSPMLADRYASIAIGDFKGKGLDQVDQGCRILRTFWLQDGPAERDAGGFAVKES